MNVSLDIDLIQFNSRLIVSVPAFNVQRDITIDNASNFEEINASCDKISRKKIVVDFLVKIFSDFFSEMDIHLTVVG